ncbi:MAG: threonine/serine ThrE exporter family protein, partial [Akkermansiaceae bacterium]
HCKKPQFDAKPQNLSLLDLPDAIRVIAPVLSQTKKRTHLGMSEQDYLKKTAFVSALGLGLHRCGATCHRIERHLSNLCELLGIHGTFLMTPTSFTFCYWLNDPTNQHIQIERVEPCEGDFGKLALLDSLVVKFEKKEWSFEQMCQGLEQALNQPANYRPWAHCLAWVALAMSFAALLSNNPANILSAGAMTVVIFFVSRLVGSSSRMVEAQEVIAAMTAGFTSMAIAGCGVPINAPFVTLSTVIVFIPGIALTVALSEVAHRSLISGVSNLVHSVMNLFKLYFGAIIGIAMGGLAWGLRVEDTLRPVQHLPSFAVLPAVIVLASSLCVVLNVRPRQIHWCLVSALIGFYVSQTGEAYFGVAAGMFLGALSVGVYANAFANIRNIPGSIVLTGGLVMLVPGSKTYIILNSWMTGEEILGHQTNINQALLIFISLVAGLLFANAILPTKKSL